MQAFTTGEETIGQTTDTECELCGKKSYVQPPNNNSEDSDDTIIAEVHLVDMVIRNIKNEFCYTREQLCYGNIDDLKSALKSYITALEELYKIFDNQ